MMNFLRSKMKIVLWIIVITFIGGIFLMQYTSNKIRTDVACINGVKIPYEVYRQQLNQRLQNIRTEKPDLRLSDSDLKQIKQDIINYLILEELLWQEAMKYGISISDAELAETIRSFPYFQKDKQFSNQLYYQTLRYVFRSTPEEYEERIKKILVTEKVKRLVLSGVKLTSQEVEFQSQRRKITKKEDTAKLPQTIMQEKMLLLRNRWLESIYKKAKIENNMQKVEKLGL